MTAMTTLMEPAAVAATREIESHFTSHDGAKIAYRAWLPEGMTGETTGVLLFHRGHEHSGRWRETVEALKLPGVAFFAWDQRGHGASDGARGDALGVSTITRDADLFARHVAAAHGVAVERMAVVAHSVGAVIAAAWVHDFAPPIRGMALAAPALEVKLYVPLAIPALRVKQKVLGPGYVKSYVKAHMLTHDVEQAAGYRNDKAIFRQISVRMLLDLHDTGRRLIADAGAMTVPTFLLLSGRDWVVKNSAQRRFYARLGSPVKQMELLPDFYHGIFHEKKRAEAVERIGRFLRECCDIERGEAARHSEVVASQGDFGGHTRTEYDRLRMPAGWMAGLQWKVARGFMKTVGRLSDGIRLGHAAGFDSGVMLDHVYKNKAKGITPLGTMIDYFYLQAIGWRGIRLRGEHVRGLLREAMEKTAGAGRPVRILDAAAGAGRYVLETMQGAKEISCSAVLRDYKEVNVAAARALAASLGVGQVTCEQGDAFDEAGLAAIVPAPTIAIISGLFELFPENGPVRATLKGLAAAMEREGFLLYTCQPWHPQIEMIARVLTNREGKPWIMRRRTQAEMDGLVREAGFEKIEQVIDPWGIFTVSLAKRL